MVFGSHSWDNVHTCVHIIIVLYDQTMPTPHLESAHGDGGDGSGLQQQVY